MLPPPCFSSLRSPSFVQWFGAGKVPNNSFKPKPLRGSA
jgi:hypothetical protein